MSQGRIRNTQCKGWLLKYMSPVPSLLITLDTSPSPSVTSTADLKIELDQAQTDSQPDRKLREDSDTHSNSSGDLIDADGFASPVLPSSRWKEFRKNGKRKKSAIDVSRTEFYSEMKANLSPVSVSERQKHFGDLRHQMSAVKEELR